MERVAEERTQAEGTRERESDGEKRQERREERVMEGRDRNGEKR